MTAKEKAKSLYGVFLKCSIEETPTNIHFDYKHLAKQCALIAVDEIIKTQGNGCMECGGGDKEYWQEVKKEIEAL